jgi:hypothetical protein
MRLHCLILVNSNQYAWMTYFFLFLNPKVTGAIVSFLSVNPANIEQELLDLKPLLLLSALDLRAQESLYIVDITKVVKNREKKITGSRRTIFRLRALVLGNVKFSYKTFD